MSLFEYGFDELNENFEILFPGYKLIYNLDQFDATSEFLKSVGRTCSRINDKYISDGIKSVIAKDPNFDMLSILNEDTKMIDAFIIVQKGECKVMPNIYSVYLICSHPKLKGRNGVGGGLTLMIAFLHSLINMFTYKNTPRSDQKAILELANNYKNIEGFITYTKLGFQKDLSLVQSKHKNQLPCLTGFYEKNPSLPMSVNLYGIKPSAFIDILTKKSAYLKRAGLFQLYRDIVDDTGLFHLFRSYIPGKSDSSPYTDEEIKEQKNKQKECADIALDMSKNQFTDDQIGLNRDYEKLRTCKNEYTSLFTKRGQISKWVDYAKSFNPYGFQSTRRKKSVKKSRKVKKSLKRNAKK